ncbi:cytochrome P450 4c3-like [Centruroides sculpturatus]|uniref:cytochrome P450 4c3-like n=1 Tax=Centruroides sculpturatus TaxID=218467 RepID=UPI000C6D7865|nr:cytochrome P450 4c3-like [Centruroides sculpturatus]
MEFGTSRTIPLTFQTPLLGLLGLQEYEIKQEDKRTSKRKQKLPKISETMIIWNSLFCPRKVQNYSSHVGIYFLQVTTGMSMLYLKEKMVISSWGGRNYILFFHPEPAQEVLKSSIIINKDRTYDFFKLWFGENSILYTKGDKWKKERKLLMPAFHFRILEKFQCIFNEQSNVLIEKLKKLKRNEVCDIIEMIKPCSLDIIAATALGVSINAQSKKSNAYFLAINGYRLLCLIAKNKLLNFDC